MGSHEVPDADANCTPADSTRAMITLGVARRKYAVALLLSGSFAMAINGPVWAAGEFGPDVFIPTLSLFSLFFLLKNHGKPPKTTRIFPTLRTLRIPAK